MSENFKINGKGQAELMRELAPNLAELMARVVGQDRHFILMVIAEEEDNSPNLIINTLGDIKQVKAEMLLMLADMELSGDGVKRVSYKDYREKLN